MSPLQSILATYRATSQTEREKGGYFEELIRTYFRYEASYADLYSDVWLFGDWAREIGTPQFGLSGKDTGIDLVARTHGTGEYHAIQCKCYAPDYRVRKADLDSFFTASGKSCFAQRIIVTTTNDWSENAEAIEMLAQHLITNPVFDALFKDYSFASHNPVSQGMQGVLDVLHEHRLEKEAETLDRFYASVEMRAAGIESAEGKQKIVVELYDKFFRNALPKMTERLGTVYTPVEVVDFIIHSVNDLLQSEFGQTLGSKGVHIIDPFTGTGTFITRLLQSGLIKPEELPHKYRNEIHADEIVLLAYYLAAINIEAVYHGNSSTKSFPLAFPSDNSFFNLIT